MWVTDAVAGDWVGLRMGSNGKDGRFVMKMRLKNYAGEFGYGKRYMIKDKRLKVKCLISS